MSLVHNIVGGAGGGKPSPTDAVLRVTAPSGSTVTIKKGTGASVTQNFYLDGTGTDTFFFYIKASNFGTYTVTATLGSDTATDSVTVNAPTEYLVELDYLVPSAYQAVEFIQNTGESYLELNYKVNTNTVMEIKLNLQNIANYGLLGNYGSNYRYGIYIDSTGNNEHYHLLNLDGQYSKNLYANTDYVIKFDKNKYYINGSYINTQTQQGDQTGNFGIFKMLNLNWSCARAKCYYVTIKEGENMVHELVPCYRKSDNVAGMWDRVAKTFLTNAGTGTFVVGEPI